MKGIHSSGIFLILLLIAVFIGYSHLQQDDAYIFYTYAKNIAEGNGYVYNPGEKVNATTSPLYTILLAVIYFPVKFIFPDSLPVIGILAGFISILVLIHLVQRMLSFDKIASYLFPFLLLSNPLLKFGIGMETYLNMALITSTFYFYYRNKFNVAAVLCALTILARLDSIIVPCILFLYHIFKYRECPQSKAILLFLTVLLPWLIFSYFYFDSLHPSTIHIKLNQQRLGFFGSGLIFIKGLFSSVPGTVITGTLIILSVILTTTYLIITKKLFESENGLKLIMIWAIVLFITYAFVLNAPPYPWYYSPFALPVSVLIAVFLGTVLKNKSQSLKNLIMALLLLTVMILPLKTFLDGLNPKYIYYKKAAAWLNKNAEENSLLAVDEIGILGYYYNKGKLIDILGLITPDIMEMQLAGNHTGYIDKYSPDYIITDYPDAPLHTGFNDFRFKYNYRKVWQTEAENQFIAIFEKND